MFQPPVFREDRIDVMQDLMRDNPFATLLWSAAGQLSAEHIPLLIHPELSEHGSIRGHVSAANPLRRQAQGEIDVLAVFQGPQAYVSPSWYPSKQQHGKVVPTWNYAVVHAHGTLRFVDEPEWLLAHLSDMTSRQERGRSSPWAISDAPDEYIARQLKALVGIEITVKSLSGSWKVSQNKDEQDRKGVELGLLAENTNQASAVSDLVKRFGR